MNKNHTKEINHCYNGLRVDISWWMFVTAGVLAILIALITVSSRQ